jgi:hypothetical protein
MIWQLVKRDPAWRMAQLFGIGAAALVALRPEEIAFAAAFGSGTLWLQSRPADRATTFHTGLPILARDLFLARLTALLLLVWLPLSTGAAVLAIRGVSLAVLGKAFEIGCFLTLLVLAALAWRVEEVGGPERAPLILWLFACAAAVPLTMIPFIPGIAVAAGLLIAAGLIFASIWVRLPLAFEVLPARVAPVNAGTSRATTDSPRMAAPLWWTLLRSMHSVRNFLIMPLVMLQVFNDQWFFGVAMALFPVLVALGQMKWARSLPLRSATIIGAVLLPTGAPLVLGVLAGSQVAPMRQPIRLVRIPGTLQQTVQPSAEYWAIATDGIAPRIVSPWGESWQPNLVRSAVVAYYNPYGREAGSSDRFLRWQFDRATRAIYGKALPFEDPAALGHTPPPRRHVRFAVLNAGACASLFLLSFLVILTGTHWRVQRRIPKSANIGVWVNTAILMGVMALEFMGSPMPDSSAALTARLLLKIASWLPAGIVPAILASVIPAVILLWLAAKLLNGMEPALTRVEARG